MSIKTVGPSEVKVGDYCLVLWKGAWNDAWIIEVTPEGIKVEFETSSRWHHKRWQKTVGIPIVDSRKYGSG